MTLMETPGPVREDCIVLTTERLVLRAPRLEDAKAVAVLANDRRIAENTLRIPHPYKLSDALRWISGVHVRSSKQSFLMLRDDDVVGACGFDLREGSDPEIGYWLGLPFWGNGYAVEAVRALIDHAFMTCGHEALVAGARVSNLASRRLLEKCGFQWRGVELHRFHAIRSSAPYDRFRLERDIGAALKSWGAPRLT
jgi:RimJ/RimL family protein N-acetyltransferase